MTLVNDWKLLSKLTKSSILDVAGALHMPRNNAQFPKGTKVQKLKLQVCSGIYDLLLLPCIRVLNKLQLFWISTHSQLSITDFAKIISYLSWSRNSQYQGTPLNGFFRSNSSTRVVNIWKWLQNVSVEQCGVAFRKGY